MDHRPSSIPDVLVVGGGPAGSATAAILARDGFDVLLLDRARFPRDKACGEFLTPGAVDCLRALGAWYSVVGAGAIPVESVEIHAPNRSVARCSPENEPVGWSIRRTALDSTLLDQARSYGAKVREGVAVRGLIREGSRVAGVRTDSREIRARLVVGADGTHSLVARELGLVRPIRQLQRVAIVSHWRGLPDSGPLEMRAFRGIVCGIGPLADGHSNITLVTPTRCAPRIAGRPGEFLEEEIAAGFPGMKERLGSARRESAVRTVGCFGHITRRAVADGGMLVGDAATFVDPFTGEGIYFALRGAAMAAATAAHALESGDVTARGLEGYELGRKELMARYLLCGVVQGVVRCGPLMNRAVAAMRRNPGLTTRLTQTIGDRLHATDALNRRFLVEMIVAART